jgi:hypothetical protein
LASRETTTIDQKEVAASESSTQINAVLPMIRYALSTMQFIQKRGEKESICLHCFLTVKPKPRQELCEAEKAHVCGVGEFDQKDQDLHG